MKKLNLLEVFIVKQKIISLFYIKKQRRNSNILIDCTALPQGKEKSGKNDRSQE